MSLPPSDWLIWRGIPYILSLGRTGLLGLPSPGQVLFLGTLWSLTVSHLERYPFAALPCSNPPWRPPVMSGLPNQTPIKTPRTTAPRTRSRQAPMSRSRSPRMSSHPAASRLSPGSLPSAPSASSTASWPCGSSSPCSLAFCWGTLLTMSGRRCRRGRLLAFPCPLVRYIPPLSFSRNTSCRVEEY